MHGSLKFPIKTLVLSLCSQLSSNAHGSHLFLSLPKFAMTFESLIHINSLHWGRSFKFIVWFFTAIACPQLYHLLSLLPLPEYRSACIKIRLAHRQMIEASLPLLHIFGFTVSVLQDSNENYSNHDDQSKSNDRTNHTSYYCPGIDTYKHSWNIASKLTNELLFTPIIFFSF